MSESKEVLLQLRGVKTFFPVRSGFFNKVTDHVQAVNDVDLDIYRGETLGLVGESGCGETTLGKSIIQLVKATDGTMMYDFGPHHGGKKDLRHLSKEEEQVLHRRIQIVFQDPYSSLNPSFTIYQSLADPLKHFGVTNKKNQRALIADILEAVNMRPEYMDRYPHEFSGGQRQRIGIARALLVHPEMVVCDEAVSALDVSIQAQVLNLLMQLKEERHLTYIFITHNLSVVEYISDRLHGGPPLRHPRGGPGQQAQPHCAGGRRAQPRPPTRGLSFPPPLQEVHGNMQAPEARAQAAHHRRGGALLRLPPL